MIVSVAPIATTSAADTANVGFFTVIVAFKVFLTVFLAFLAVTLTRYTDEFVVYEYDKMGIFGIKKQKKFSYK